MWWIVAVAVIAILVAALSMLIGPFLTLRPLPERAEINGMTLVKDGFVSAVLVPLSKHEVALVDAGNDVQAKALLAELSRRGLGPDNVDFILLTHGHADHIGGIAKFPKAQVMALAEEVEVVEGRSTGGGLILRFRSPKPTGIRLSRTLHERGYAIGFLSGPRFRSAGPHAGQRCVCHWGELVSGGQRQPRQTRSPQSGALDVQCECGAEPQISA